MVEKSGVERSGVEAWGWKVQGWDVLQPDCIKNNVFEIETFVSTCSFTVCKTKHFSMKLILPHEIQNVFL